MIRIATSVRRLLCVALTIPALLDAQRRPLAVDDLFRLKQLGAVVPSPKGGWLAIVIKRARSAAEVYTSDFLLDDDHADIWLVPRDGGEPRNITHGIDDGSGSWNPVWSPDGKRIAFLSTKGGDNVRLYVWDVSKMRPLRLTERGVELSATAEAAFPTQPISWINDTTLLCPVVPAGERPLVFETERRTQLIAPREWARARAGMEPTASVLESGRRSSEANRGQGQLLLIDATSGAKRVVAEGNIRRIIVSPTRQSAAVITANGVFPPRADTRLAATVDMVKTRLGILRLNAPGGIVWIDGVSNPAMVLANTSSPHSWSPDGTWLAVVGSSGGRERANAVFLVSAFSGRARQVARCNCEVKTTIWSGNGELLALMRPRVPGQHAGRTVAYEWKVVDTVGRNAMRALPSERVGAADLLVRTTKPDIMVGMVAGKLWTIDLANGRSRNITASLGASIDAIVWPRTSQLKNYNNDILIVRTTTAQQYVITIAGLSARVERLSVPAPEAGIVAFDPGRALEAFSAVNDSGTFLWTRSGQKGSFVRRVSLNTNVAGIASAERMLVGYRGVEGDSLRALLVLPIGYQPGRRYPLITWVYAGLMVKDTLYGLLGKQTVNALNLELLPAHGYALLIPSMPLPPTGFASDPYIEMPKGVMGAIDKVIDLGIADPARLGLMGHSYGGYSTYSLVTYTHRFKAAVALAGFADLASDYGVFDARRRYAPYAHEAEGTPALFESGQSRMGDSPWGNLWRYIRNSPYYYADRVQTPLMIIQGDVDFVPMQQGEEFFTALYRMGREAEFVRYWGESHVVKSPANIRDMWRRIFGWFDEHLCVGMPGSQAGCDIAALSTSSSVPLH